MQLSKILELEPVEQDRWLAHTPTGSGREDVFGGQVAGQALAAASKTIEDGHRASSVHCYFLRRGQPDIPLEIRVDRVRTGRTYSSRRVEVSQLGKLVFEMWATFHIPEPGREFVGAVAPDVPSPEELDAAEPPFDSPLDIKIVQVNSDAIRWWGRAKGGFPEDPSLQRCGLLFASDLFAGGAAIEAIGFSTFEFPADDDGVPTANFGSLDHAVWFHREPTISDWFLCEVKAVSVSDSRGLGFGTVFDRSGTHVASFSQEMFLKVF